MSATFWTSFEIIVNEIINGDPIIEHCYNKQETFPTEISVTFGLAEKGSSVMRKHKRDAGFKRAKLNYARVPMESW